MHKQHFMKRLSIIALSLVLLGAGCLGRSSGSTGADAGVFKSMNAGEEWAQYVVVPTAQGIGTLATTNVLHMTMDPQDNEFLYIATRGNGMLYSEDAGASWRQVRDRELQSGTISHVAVDAKEVCTVYVATGSRLFRTDDCMRSFDSETYVDNRGETITRVAVDWYDNDNVWIGMSNGDVLKSEDAGNTWRTVLKTSQSITAFLMSNTDSRQVMVATDRKGIWKTTDGGGNWTSLEEGLDEYNDGDNVYALVQSADSGVVIAATEYGLLRSQDFGESWEAVELVTSPGQVEIRAVAVNEKNPDLIYYAANATYYYSQDGGSTWLTERLATTRTPTVLLVDPEDSAVLYVAVANLED